MGPNLVERLGSETIGPIASGDVSELLGAVDFARIGGRIYHLIEDLYPICRSITGNGMRTTLRRLQDQIPLELHEVPTGTRVFDWVVPKEWNIRDAWIKNAAGEKIVDFHQSNLHVVGYSIPTHRTISLSELRPHLHTLADRPDWIPYRTSYYQESWGFCLSYRQLETLADEDYEVFIDSTLEDGSLTYGECYLPGRLSDEVLLSCHACHPSLCNDNLSGVCLAAALAGLLRNVACKYSYRILFLPGTIGAITWLASNPEAAARIHHGLVIACVGDRGKLQYKRSRRGQAEIDHAVVHVLRHSGQPFEIRDFSPYGYDERQYCSPAFNLPVGSLTRTPHGTFAEYHTSADDLAFVCPEALANTLSTYLSVINIVEHNDRCMNLNPQCEPQLGRRGLYHALGGLSDANRLEMALLWVLNLSDGRSSLLEIADRADLPFDVVRRAADLLKERGLLRGMENCAS